mmetsp:Transcript_89474/g.164018  ORF Transcript_89474/g.164018 Transcript_89474/m.164018 type:complete len:427 (+) Transcript_89474:111-1391(+)
MVKTRGPRSLLLGKKVLKAASIMKGQACKNGGHKLPVLRNLRTLNAEVVRFRAKESSKMQHARVPSVVLELLRLRAKCEGMRSSPPSIARQAVVALQEHAYDPVCTIASVSRACVLEPRVVTRVLGSGEHGTVFMDEEGNVVKVMFDDEAPDEFWNQRQFADAGLAPRPLALCGPQMVCCGHLYNIRMEAIDCTLCDLLWAEAPSARPGRSLPDDAFARKLGQGLVAIFQRMWERGLVHGDLHTENVGLKEIAGAEPNILLIDFSRSASLSKRVKKTYSEASKEEDFKGGHEFDVFNLIQELCTSFEGLKFETTKYTKELRQGIRALKRRKAGPRPRVAGSATATVTTLERDLAWRCDALDRSQKLHDIIICEIVRYAVAKCNMRFDGPLSMSNQQMLDENSKRLDASYAKYFASTLYWGDWEYPA